MLLLVQGLQSSEVVPTPYRFSFLVLPLTLIAIYERFIPTCSDRAGLNKFHTERVLVAANAPL